MSQNREAPAFQEYAASMLSQLPFRTMTLQDRGLLYTMRLECWVNERLPRSHNELAKIFGLPVNEVFKSLSAVMPFFEIMDGFIISPELENYRAHLAERRIRQSEGGKQGSAITNDKRKRPAKKVDMKSSSTSSSTSQPPRQGGSESLVKSSAKKQSQNRSTGGGVIDDPFVRGYEAAEQSCTALTYAKASRGG